MFGQLAASKVIAQGPTFAAQNQICFVIAAAADRFRQTDDFEWNLLFRGATNLLPFERNQKAPAVFRRHGIDPVGPAAGTVFNYHLLFAFVTASKERGHDSRIALKPWHKLC